MATEKIKLYFRQKPEKINRRRSAYSVVGLDSRTCISIPISTKRLKLYFMHFVKCLNKSKSLKTISIFAFLLLLTKTLILALASKNTLIKHNEEELIEEIVQNIWNRKEPASIISRSINQSILFQNLRSLTDDSPGTRLNVFRSRGS